MEVRSEPLVKYRNGWFLAEDVARYRGGDEQYGVSPAYADIRCLERYFDVPEKAREIVFVASDRREDNKERLFVDQVLVCPVSQVTAQLCGMRDESLPATVVWYFALALWFIAADCRYIGVEWR